MAPSSLVESEAAASCVQKAVCDCAHHRRQEAGSSPAEVPGSRWAALAPILACAVCPACLATYAKVLSFLGVGVSLTESTHHLLLVIAVGVSLGASAWKALRLHRWGPLLVTVLGCALLVTGHALDEDPVLTWGGVAVLLGGALWERQAWRRGVASRGKASPLAAGLPGGSGGLMDGAGAR
ncbi:MerC family mercury resistance protein [Corallococcus exercitus]|uniref:MerC family mercury resistance protein n=1 Tax=Corallococcus exercitus TaxID=2316736 RepID=UPI0035D4D9DD